METYKTPENIQGYTPGVLTTYINSLVPPELRDRVNRIIYWDVIDPLRDTSEYAMWHDWIETNLRFGGDVADTLVIDELVALGWTEADAVWRVTGLEAV